MKPTKPEIEWVLTNAEVVTAWLEQRGGLRFGDRVWIKRQSKVAIVQRFYVFTDH